MNKCNSLRWMYSCFLFACFLFSFSSCKKSDKELIVGKWKNEENWFDYKNDMTYTSGIASLTMTKPFKYTIDEKTKQLNMYTDLKERSFYLIYEFFSDDTLAVRNVMSSNKTMIKFYRELTESK